jgi:hypothetical protein
MPGGPGAPNTKRLQVVRAPGVPITIWRLDNRKSIMYQLKLLSYTHLLIFTYSAQFKLKGLCECHAFLLLGALRSAQYRILKQHKLLYCSRIISS